jgi:hypothetical protein
MHKNLRASSPISLLCQAASPWPANWKVRLPSCQSQHTKTYFNYLISLVVLQCIYGESSIRLWPECRADDRTIRFEMCLKWV